eukprot:758261-Hanusia_phi.AAC.1
MLPPARFPASASPAAPAPSPDLLNQVLIDRGAGGKLRFERSDGVLSKSAKICGVYRSDMCRSMHSSAEPREHLSHLNLEAEKQLGKGSKDVFHSVQIISCTTQKNAGRPFAGWKGDHSEEVFFRIPEVNFPCSPLCLCMPRLPSDSSSLPWPLLAL